MFSLSARAVIINDEVAMIMMRSWALPNGFRAKIHGTMMVLMMLTLGACVLPPAGSVNIQAEVGRKKDPGCV